MKENKEKERLERRLLDELDKIFMDSDSFYYSLTYDLTNTVQRQGHADKAGLPLWKQVCRAGRTSSSGAEPLARTSCLDSQLLSLFVEGGRSFLLEQTHDPRHHRPGGRSSEREATLGFSPLMFSPTHHLAFIL